MIIRTERDLRRWVQWWEDTEIDPDVDDKIGELLVYARSVTRQRNELLTHAAEAMQERERARELAVALECELARKRDGDHPL